MIDYLGTVTWLLLLGGTAVVVVIRGAAHYLILLGGRRYSGPVTAYGIVCSLRVRTLGRDE